MRIEPTNYRPGTRVIRGAAVGEGDLGTVETVLKTDGITFYGVRFDSTPDVVTETAHFRVERAPRPRKPSFRSISKTERTAVFALANRANLLLLKGRPMCIEHAVRDSRIETDTDDIATLAVSMFGGSR